MAEESIDIWKNKKNDPNTNLQKSNSVIDKDNSISTAEKIDPDVISNVVMDLDNYGEFLSNANTLDSRILNITDEYVDGYQHIKVTLPFFSDRR